MGRRRKTSYAAILGRTVNAIDLPFGYTLTVWSTGQIVYFRYGLIAEIHIFYFVVGAIGAYLLAAGISRRISEEAAPLRRQAITVINVFAVLAAGVVSFLSHLVRDPGIAYAVAGFVGTLTYITSFSGLVYFAQWLAPSR